MQTNRIVGGQQASAPKDEVSAIMVMAKRLNCDPEKLLTTLKKTVFKIKDREATTEELMVFVIVANKYNLNPFLKEIYPVLAKGGGIIPIISIDGWHKIYNSNPNADGIDYEWETGDNGELVRCTALVFRKDRGRPEKGTAWFKECVRDTDVWRTYPYWMLEIRATTRGIRRAFGLSGAIDPYEAEEIVVNSEIDTPQQRKYPISSPKFEKLPEKKAELFSAKNDDVVEAELELPGGVDDK